MMRATSVAAKSASFTGSAAWWVGGSGGNESGRDTAGPQQTSEESSTRGIGRPL